MGTKKLIRAWKKGNKEFPSVYGVKDLYAKELLLTGGIKIPKRQVRGFGVTDIRQVSPKKAAQILQALGWEWVKRDVSRET
jgi:hypothetical protein